MRAPLHGHLYPMLPLAHAAQAAGHQVVVATGADIAPLAQREGLATWSIGMTHAQAGGNRQASWLGCFEAGASQRIAQLTPRLSALASVLSRCTAVVSQGCSGVMFGAMAHGLPQLMLPQGADQFRNAEVCAPTGAALALAPQDATPGAISDAVRQLLNGGRFANAARRLRDQIVAMPDADVVIAALTMNRRTTVST